MSLASGNHAGVKTTSALRMGANYQPLGIMLGRNQFTSIVYFRLQACQKNETVPTSIVYFRLQACEKMKPTPRAFLYSPSISLKIEGGYEHGSLPVSSSLKIETVL